MYSVCVRNAYRASQEQYEYISLRYTYIPLLYTLLLLIVYILKELFTVCFSFSLHQRWKINIRQSDALLLEEKDQENTEKVFTVRSKYHLSFLFSECQC